MMVLMRAEDPSEETGFSEWLWDSPSVGKAVADLGRAHPELGDVVRARPVVEAEVVRRVGAKKDTDPHVYVKAMTQWFTRDQKQLDELKGTEGTSLLFVQDHGLIESFYPLDVVKGRGKYLRPDWESEPLLEEVSD